MLFNLLTKVPNTLSHSINLFQGMEHEVEILRRKDVIIQLYNYRV